jgi:phosphate transport system permease protein
VITESPPLRSDAVEERPISIAQRLTGPDRAFEALLASTAGILLTLLLAIGLFLAYHGWWALDHFKLGFFTGTTWAAPIHPGVLGLLVGSVEIALVALTAALPVGVATALLINEYANPGLRRWMTGLIDLLATVPSIVYGFWGLEAVDVFLHGTVKWMVQYLGFVPIFRTTEPNNYGNSVFICGVIVAIMISPVIASVTREVMSQVPRDACEAALALGGTRWGMIVDVVVPFSKSGIIGGALLGLSRALGETMAVVLVLSSTDIVSKAILGPGGGSVAAQIAETFPISNAHGQSELTLAGLTLFATTLLFSLGGREIVRRSGGVVSG